MESGALDRVLFISSEW